MPEEAAQYIFSLSDLRDGEQIRFALYRAAMQAYYSALSCYDHGSQSDGVAYLERIKSVFAHFELFFTILGFVIDMDETLKRAALETLAEKSIIYLTSNQQAANSTGSKEVAWPLQTFLSPLDRFGTLRLSNNLACALSELYFYRHQWRLPRIGDGTFQTRSHGGR